MDPVIRQVIDELTAAHNEASARLRSLAEQRRHLEERRRRMLMQLEEPGDSAPDLHRSLADVDNQLDQRRREEQMFRRKAQEDIDALRDKVRRWEQARREAIEKDLQASQAETDRLRDELIPEARRYLEDLEERHKLVQSRAITLANERSSSRMDLPDLSRFDLAE